MLRWTLRNLIAEPLTLLANASAIGGALALVLFFEAVFAGESKQIVAYLQRSNPDVWVMQRGVANMHMATSFVSDWKADDLRDVPGVNRVTPILYLNTVIEAGGQSWFTFVVGLKNGDPRAGPWKMTAGKKLPGPGEAVLPDVMATMTGLKLGDTINIGGHDFTLAGLSADTFSMGNSITFVTMDDLSDVMSTTGSASYFLIDGAQGVSPADLAARIMKHVSKVNAVPSARFITNDWDVAMQMGLEIVGMMTVVGAALAVLLTGFAVFSHTARKEPEYAVMKALGVRNRAIYASVAVQAAWLAFLGFVVAVAIVELAVPLTRAYTPQVTLYVTSDAVINIALAALVVALLSTIIPVRRIVRIDPVMAFKN